MNKLIDILSSLHPEIDFTTSHELISEGILDSIDIVTLIGEICDMYSISVPVEEIRPENFASVESIDRMIKRLGGSGVTA